MEDYQFLDRLGNGKFGKVWKAKKKSDGKIVAVKEIDYSHLDQKQRQLLCNEVSILRKLHNKYIVRYYEHFVNRKEKKIYIIMEFCEGGDLQNFIRETRANRSYINEDQIWMSLTELAVALRDCHYGNTTILHRDIKPGNIFIDALGHVKLGDFGLARNLNSNRDFATTCLGTPYYMSPEINDGMYDEKSDIWALGCVIYEMAQLRTPFIGFGIEDLKNHIINSEPQRISSKYSDSLWNIIRSMLEKDPQQRPTILDILKYRNVSITLKMIQTREKLQDVRQKYNELMKKKKRLQYRENHKNTIEM